MNWRKWKLEQEAEAGSTSGASGTAATETPAAATETPAPADNAAGGDVAAVDNVDDWGGELSNSADDDSGDGVQGEAKAPKEEATPAAAAPAAKSAETPAAATAATPQAKVETPAATAAAAAPAATPAQAAAPAPAETAEQTAARVAAQKAAEEKLFKDLEEYYKLPEDLAEKLQTEPENVLPHLAAKMHQSVLQGVQRFLEHSLPQYLTQHGTIVAAEAKAKAAFYEANPDLVQYEEQVLQAGRVYRQMNPQAPADKAIKAIADIVRASMGLTVVSGGGQQQVATSTTTAPAFTPAGSSGAPAGNRPAKMNEFEQLALEQDD